MDVLTNPPVPEWNELRDEYREIIVQAWEIESCPHACSGNVTGIYNAIRKALQKRERHILQSTMDMPTSNDDE